MPTAMYTTSAPATASATSVVNASRSPFRCEQLLEPRLVDRHVDRREARRSSLRDDVADDDVVPELREARARDEADVPRAEDGDSSPCYFAFTEPSGLRPLAIASIVSFESRSSSVLTTQ